MISSPLFDWLWFPRGGSWLALGCFGLFFNFSCFVRASEGEVCFGASEGDGCWVFIWKFPNRACGQWCKFLETLFAKLSHGILDLVFVLDFGPICKIMGPFGLFLSVDVRWQILSKIHLPFLFTSHVQSLLGMKLKFETNLWYYKSVYNIVNLIYNVINLS